jgi:hypothetical protein
MSSTGLLDSVEAEFYTKTSLRDPALTLGLLRYILHHGPTYMPNRWWAKHATGRRYRRFTLANLERLTLDLQDYDSYTIDFDQQAFGAHRLILDLGFRPELMRMHEPLGRVLLSLPQEYFRGPDACLHVNEWLQVLQGIHDRISPYYGYSHETRDHGAITTITTTTGGMTETRDRTQAYAPALFWANFFGPQLADAIGREQLEAAPCWRRQPLADGGLLLVFSPNPLEVEASREVRQRLYEEWKLEELTLPARATVSPRAVVSQLSQENTLDPTVASVDQCREYAELCVRLAQKLNQVALDYSPESLTKLDQIIRTSWHGGVSPEQVVTVMGCYLGETIIRTLGGHWSWEVPSPGLTRPYVQVGAARLNVIGKVAKRFRGGEEDSLAWFYEILVTQRLSTSAPGGR